jgi:type II secretory pathway pseudopilin PulG
MKQSFALVLLVTVIVGVATVIAIQSFTNATSDDVNLDAVRQDMASLAAAARGYHMRPVALDGGGGVFTGITFRKIVFATDFIHPGDLISHNANGTYVLLATDSSVSITAFPASRPGYVTGDTTGVSLNAVATTGTITWIRMEPDSADAPAL